jgi:uncharacterized phiE125 gp8 family phage protein
MISILKSPSTLCVSVANVRDHLRLNHGAEDAYLERLIQAATQQLEAYTGRSLIRRTLRLVKKAPGTAGIWEISLSYPPILDILEVNALTGFDKGQAVRRYMFDQELGKVSCYGGDKDVEIIYDAGYGNHAKSVPEVLRQAVLMMVTDLYEYRGMNKPGGEAQGVAAWEALVAPYVMRRLR